jgi:hypothetical protein
MLRLLISVVCLFIAVATACYFFFLYPPALKNNLKSMLERHLNADIKLGSAELRPFSGLTLSGIDVRRAPGQSRIFHADRIRISPRLQSLLRFRLQTKEISLENAAITFSRDSKGASNWAGVLKESAAPAEERPPAFNLKNGRVTIGDHTFEGLNCELNPFPSRHTIAIRGRMDDSFWGDYRLHGSIDTKRDILTLSFDAKDLNLTERWVRDFPLMGRNVWDRYRPEGIFDFMGTVNYSWGKTRTRDYSLTFTAKDSSCKYLIFPVSRATGRIFIDPHSVIVNNLKGELFKGVVEGFSLANMEAPFTYFSRYAFTDVDTGEFLKDFKAQLQGKATGAVSFHGDHSLGNFKGQGNLSIPDARLWKFPVILQIISRLQLKLWAGEGPPQDCTVAFSIDENGITFKKISLVSDVLDIYGQGWSSYKGDLRLVFYARPVSKTPIILADIIVQKALDSISGNLAQFEVRGTLANPTITVIPLTPVSKNISDFFDALTRRRLRR